jgi:glycosyltransferase involved in cell wall biosynthesis
MTRESEDAPDAGCIVLAAYHPDKEHFRTQLLSLSRQTIKNWNCLVVADGDAARISEIIREAVPGDTRFRVLGYADHVGFYRNFERGLRAVPATASWVALADQDDDWYPHKLQVLSSALAGATLVSGQAHVGRRDGTSSTTTRRSATLNALMIDNQITGSFTLFRRDLLDIILPFPSNSDLAFHDHWIGICARASGNVRFLDEPLQLYVQHAHNVIGEKNHEPIKSRVARLSAIGKASGGWLHVLIDQRLGWRRTMASALIDRLPDNHPSHDDLDMWAHPHRARLAGGILRVLAHRQAPPLRAAALAVAAIAEPRPGEAR